nr:protein GOLM2-like [Dermatophagoides farinae]
MGLSSAARGHMRPFGGRSPPFLVATLCVGICVLGISYWRLGIQYNDLEDQLRRLIQKKDSLEANESFISKQLELREENFSEAKVNLQKKEKELLDLQKRFDEQSEMLITMKKTNNDFEHTVNDLHNKMKTKETIISGLREKNQILIDENKKLKSDYMDVKSRLDSQSSKQHIQSSSSSIKNADESILKAQQQQQQQLERSQLTNVIHSPPSSLNNDNNNNPIPLPPKLSSLPSSSMAPGIVVEAQSQAVAAIPETIHKQQQPPPEQQQNSDQIHHHSNEQIQKPKIDPVIKLIKNNVGSLDDNNDHQRQPKSFNQILDF